jgi:hypothetical protein
LVRLQTPIGAIQASTKSIELPACEVFRVEGEKMKSSGSKAKRLRARHTIFDMFTLLTLIGAMEGAAPAKKRGIS